MNQRNQMIKINVNWKQSFLYPYITILVILLIYLFIYGINENELLFIGPIFLIIVIAQYLFSTQFEVTSILLGVGKVVIKFPLSFFLKERIFLVEDIISVEFRMNPGSKAVPRFYINTKDGRRIKYYYSGLKSDTDIFSKFLESYNLPTYSI